MKRSFILAAASTFAFFGTAASAQTAATVQSSSAGSGFAVNHFAPSERGSEWFVMESLDLTGHLRPALGVVGEWAYRPLVLTDASGNVRDSIVRDQFFVHAGGSLVVWDRVRFAVDLPVLLHDDGHSLTSSGVTYAAPKNEVGVGDLRLGADVRLFGLHGEALTAALGAQVSLPTGSQSDYAGDGSVRVLPRVLVAGDIGAFTYAAKAGVDIRALGETYASGTVGSDVFLGGAVGLRVLDKKLVVGPEVFGQSVFSSGPFFAKKSSPVEGLLGAHYTLFDALRIGAGVGTGFGVGYGSPAFRGMGSIEWTPGANDDRDHDGVPDRMDACIDVPGVETDDPKTGGCPAVGDRDHDGIVDPEDKCPDVAGLPRSDTNDNGCPPDRDHDGVFDDDDACIDVPGVKTNKPTTDGCPSDRDEDGIVDTIDACPDTPGVQTGDPKTNGCPEDVDRDKDGINNDVDACPDEAGAPDPDPKKNGCPKAVVRNGQIAISSEVKFKEGKAEIEADADNDAVLTAVQDVLAKHPEITSVDVQGYTDNRGNPKANKKLSAERAAAVVKWLVGLGVAPSRLTSQGFGQEHPRDSNTTEEGRANNRRVEFHIVGGGAPSGPGSDKPNK